MKQSSEPKVSNKVLELAQFRLKDKEKFFMELNKVPRYRREKLQREAISYSIWLKGQAERKLVLSFPTKTWEISLKDRDDAWVFGKMLAGASYSGIWFPSKKRITSNDLTSATCPNKAGNWYLLMWDVDSKSFVIQKYKVDANKDIVPTDESSSSTAVDYYIPVKSRKPIRSKKFTLQSAFKSKVKQNPFAFLELFGLNIAKTGREKPFVTAKNPIQDYKQMVFSRRYLFEQHLSDSKQAEKYFVKATTKGNSWVIKLVKGLPKYKEEAKKRTKMKRLKRSGG